jgi:hypothetical protein
MPGSGVNFDTIPPPFFMSAPGVKNAVLSLAAPDGAVSYEKKVDGVLSESNSPAQNVQ